MNKNYKYGFVFGVILYVILNVCLKISRLYTTLIVLGILIIEYVFLRFYKMKIQVNNLNQFVNITDQSVEKLIENKKALQRQLHDIKNHLMLINEYLEDRDKAKNEVDKALIECVQNANSPICPNAYVDTFLSRFVKDHDELEYDMKINVVENINMKAMDLSSLMICILQDNYIKTSGVFYFHMKANDNELVVKVKYPNEIQGMDEETEILLKMIVKKYNGNLEIKKNQIQCILFL